MQFRRDLKEGRELGVPFCCRLRFAVGYLINPDSEQALKRGIRFNRNGIEYVRCRVFHDAVTTHQEHEQWINLRVFEGLTDNPRIYAD